MSESHMETISAERLVESFPEAIEGGSIRAFFQPVFRTMTERMIGAEALARWFLPDGRMLPPDQFIPAMEESGLIFRMDMEILRQSCALYDELRRRGTPIQLVSVNLSRRDFEHEELFGTVCATLDGYSVPHEAIKLEITESMMLEDTERFEKTFRLFSEAGFKVWLDDFGSGYSSLNVLQSYSFDVIKFDMLFLRKMSARGREVLTSLISMAKTLGIHTLTEGVENEEQLSFLRTVGCEALQGFYFSRPLSREDLTALIDGKENLLESGEDFDYWNEIGRLNHANSNPLKDFSERRNAHATGTYVSSYDGSFALVECSADHFNYVYATEGYREMLRNLGFMSVGSLEQALSNQRSHQFLTVHNLVMEALRTGTMQTVEYAYKDVYYRLAALSIARKKNKVMIALRLNTFDSEREVETAREMLNNSSALLTTYDLVVRIMPGQDAAKRIYTANSLAEYDREPDFASSLRKFCREHVAEEDQERFLRFLNARTLAERLAGSPGMFIQQLFRMRLEKDRTAWYSARITQNPQAPEAEYLLTVQSIQGSLTGWIDQIVKEHPGLV